jgi:tRNA dimethylallyltransferase
MNTPLIVILGPTASGKSGLALRLARAFKGEIVNCDSVQVYRCLDIGTSKVLPAERQGVPHHLLDILEPDQWFTAGDYLVMGRRILEEIRGRGGLPIVVGGTGFYLRALLTGLFDGPSRSQSLRQRLIRSAEAKGKSHLHRMLQRLDPLSAGRIASSDQPKIVRALEVFFLTSKPLSQHFEAERETLQGFDVLKIGLDPPRKGLYSAIDSRVDHMFCAGLVDEVQSVLDRGFSGESKSLQSLGYGQVQRYLRGETTLQEAIAQTKQGTRRYAKRQMTWFRKEEGVIWFHGFGTDLVLQAEVAALAKTFVSRQQMTYTE